MMKSFNIDEASNAILTSFEFTCEWPSMVRCREIIFEETDYKPTNSETVSALRIAQVKWEELKVSTKNKVFVDSF